MTRVLFAGVLFFAAIVAPVSVTFFLIICGLLWFPRHFESVAAALLIDLLYRGEGHDMFNIYFPFPVIIFACLCVIDILRTFIRERRA